MLSEEDQMIYMQEDHETKRRDRFSKHNNILFITNPWILDNSHSNGHITVVPSMHSAKQ